MALTPLAEALETLLASVVSQPTTQSVPLAAALNRYCAEDVISTLAVPPADNSAMDGYALRAADTPGDLVISQRIPAGQAPQSLQPGTAARIFTGAEIPPGADTVVMQESVEITPAGIRVTALEAGRHIRGQGDDIQLGQCVLTQGRCLLPQDLGLLAAVGRREVSIFRPLKVAILTTGDELVEPGSAALAPGQIYNSNRVALAAQIDALGMEVLDLGNLPDEPGQIGDALERAAREADCVITAGGVSVGEEDHVRHQIEARGSLTHWKLAIKPGKPLAFGEVCGTPVFGLPGNPVSALVTFALVAKPWLIKRQGGRVPPLHRFPVRAGFALTEPGTRQEFLRVRLVGEGAMMTAELTRSQSSGVLSSVSEAHALADIPIGTTVAEGDWVGVIPLSTLLGPGSA